MQINQVSAPIRVFIVETNRMGCQLMATAFERSHSRVEVVGTAVESAGLAGALSRCLADIVIVSVQLKDGEFAGFSVARELRDRHPGTRVIMLLQSIDRPTVLEAFRAGAVGILSREDAFKVLCKCVHAVHSGQVWANSEQLHYLVDALAQFPGPHASIAKVAKPATLLTKREEGLVHLVAEGFTNKDISRELKLSEHTVRNYLFRIFNKLGTSNRLELALYALNRRDA